MKLYNTYREIVGENLLAKTLETNLRILSYSEAITMDLYYVSTSRIMAKVKKFKGHEYFCQNTVHALWWPQFDPVFLFHAHVTFGSFRDSCWLHPGLVTATHKWSRNQGAVKESNPRQLHNCKWFMNHYTIQLKTLMLCFPGRKTGWLSPLFNLEGLHICVQACNVKYI